MLMVSCERLAKTAEGQNESQVKESYMIIVTMNWQVSALDLRNLRSKLVPGPASDFSRRLWIPPFLPSLEEQQGDTHNRYTDLQQIHIVFLREPRNREKMGGLGRTSSRKRHRIEVRCHAYPCRGGHVVMSLWCTAYWKLCISDVFLTCFKLSMYLLYVCCILFTSRCCKICSL